MIQHSDTATQVSELLQNVVWKRYVCFLCGFIYDEQQGWPEEGIPAGTPWKSVPDDWICPDCKTVKADFCMMEIS